METRPLLILGASGRTGRPLVEQALAAGWKVRALVRDPARLGLHHPALEVVQGNVLDLTSVRTAVEGCAGVLSTLGRDGGDLRPLLEGTDTIVTAMKETGVKRLVLMSSLGAGSTRHLAGPVMGAMIALSGLKASFEAKGRQEQVLLGSGLEVSVVFAATLSNGPKTSQQRVTAVEATRARWLARISRADVADFMLREFTQDTWVGRSVCVA